MSHPMLKDGISTPKRIIFFHISFAIPAEIWWEPHRHPSEIRVRQTVVPDLPKDFILVVEERRLQEFPDIFQQHTDTLLSLLEAIRNAGVSIFLKKMA